MQTTRSAPGRVSEAAAFLLGILAVPTALLATSLAIAIGGVDPDVAWIFAGGFLALALVALPAIVGFAASTWVGAAAGYAGAVLTVMAGEAWLASPGMPGLISVSALGAYVLLGVAIGHGARVLVRSVRSGDEASATAMPSDATRGPSRPGRIAAVAHAMTDAVAAFGAGCLTAGAVTEAGRASFLLDDGALPSLLAFIVLGGILGAARKDRFVLVPALAGVLVGEAVSLSVAGSVARGDATYALVGTADQVRLDLAIGAVLPVLAMSASYGLALFVVGRETWNGRRWSGTSVARPALITAAASALVATGAAAALGYASAVPPLVAVQSSGGVVRVMVDGEGITTDTDHATSPVLVQLEIREMPFGGYYWFSLIGPLSPAEVEMVYRADFTPSDLREKWQEFDYGPGQRSLGTLPLEPGTYVWFRHPMDGGFGSDGTPSIVPLTVD